MSIIVKKPEGGGGFDPVPEGTYQAVCYAVWDIGIQSTVMNGQEKRQHKIIISWEIDKLIETEGEYKGKRFVISNRYTMSLHEKATLFKHLESWRGKAFTEKELENGFDIEKVIGVNCLLGVIHNKKGDKTYTNVSTVMKCTNGMPKMEPENDQEPPEWVKKLQVKGTVKELTEDQKADKNVDELFDAPSLAEGFGANEIDTF